MIKIDDNELRQVFDRMIKQNDAIIYLLDRILNDELPEDEEEQEDEDEESEEEKPKSSMKPKKD